VTYSYDRSASSGWDDADTIDCDDAENLVTEDVREIRRYIKRCGVLIEPYKKLAEALEAPKLLKFAEHLGERIKDLEQVAELLQKGRPFFKRFGDDFEKMCEELAEGRRTLRHGLIEEVSDLPVYNQIREQGQTIESITDRIHEQDQSDTPYIDWTLDDYVGSEAGIYRKIQRVSPGAFYEVTNVTAEKIFYGVLKYYTDAEYIDERIQEFKEEA
jgi:hypothetical protein